MCDHDQASFGDDFDKLTEDHNGALSAAPIVNFLRLCHIVANLKVRQHPQIDALVEGLRSFLNAGRDFPFVVLKAFFSRKGDPL